MHGSRPRLRLSRWWRVLRDAAWLSADRAIAYRRILLVLWVLAIIGMIVTAHGGMSVGDKPLGTDFVSFWTAAKLALHGHPAEAYRPVVHAAAERALFPHMEAGYFAFFYPPIFLALCLPLALLPYFPALWLWLLATGAAYWRVMTRLLSRQDTPLPGVTVTVLAYPAVLVDLGFGQNGLLSAALFGAFVLALPRRPGWAGFWAGCLIYKPHLGLALPIVLIAGRHWRALGTACATAMGLAALSLVMFGLGTWRAFLGIGGAARQALEMGQMGFGKQVSVFAAARQLGQGVAVSYGAQIGVGLAVAAVVLVLVLRRRPAHLRADGRDHAGDHGVLAVAASLLMTPFALEYDLVVLAVPLAWLLSEALRDGFLPYEKTILALAYIAPLILPLIAMGSGVPLVPVVMLAVFALVARRVARAGGAL